MSKQIEIETATVAELATMISEIGPFEYDWCMTWGDEQAETNGEGDWKNLTDEDARESAKEYEESVLSAATEADYQCELAAKALRDGDLASGLKYLEAASREESQFGDCPTYKLYLDRLNELIESGDSLAEDLKFTDEFFQESGKDCAIGFDIWGKTDPVTDCNHFTWGPAMRHILSADDRLNIYAARQAKIKLEDVE